MRGLITRQKRTLDALRCMRLMGSTLTYVILNLKEVHLTYHQQNYNPAVWHKPENQVRPHKATLIVWQST